MFSSKTAFASIALAVFGLSAHALGANIIYSDDFSGTGASNLFGTTPDTAAAHNGVGAGSTWSGSDAKFKDDGTLAFDATSNRRGVWLPFNPLAGTIYKLSASIELATGTGGYTTLGFAVNNPDNEFNTAGPSGADPYGTAMVRADNTGVFPADGNGASDVNTFDGVVLNGNQRHETGNNGVNEIEIILDASDANSLNWTVEYFADGNSLAGPNTVASGDFGDIQYVGLSTIIDGPGSVDDFSLVIIPEPASLALLGLGGLMIARRR